MEHNWYICSKECAGCIYCNGGLDFCTVCKGGEVQLPTDCPGKKMTEEQRQAVTSGILNYKEDRGWIAVEKKKKALDLA